MDEWVTIKSNINGAVTKVSKGSLALYIDNERWSVVEEDEVVSETTEEGETESSTQETDEEFLARFDLE